MGPWIVPAAWGVLVLAGCGGAQKDEPRTAHHPSRERVLAFWKAFRAATDARIQRDVERAAGLYDEALALDPVHEDSLYYLGQCRRELARPAAARAAFERLVAVNPHSARGQLALGALLASPDPHEPMDLQAAELHLRRAHNINGEETGPVVRLGEVALVRGRHDEARSWFESALRTNPRSVEAALLSGYIERTGPGRRNLAPLVARVRNALKVERPIRGVLGEGDRRPEASPAAGQPAGPAAAAPPLDSPLGRLLFEAPVHELRRRASQGRTLLEQDVLDAWRRIDTLLREYEERSSSRDGA